MENILLVGGSGFIGKNLVEYLTKDYKIVVADKNIDEEFFSKIPSVGLIKIDLTKDLIPNNCPPPDYIINLASIVTAERDISLFEEMVPPNIKILLNLYERFKGDNNLKMFMQFGSSEEYGTDGSPFKEHMRECPNSPYALIKQLTVNTALMLHANYGFPSMVIRPANLFGKYQNSSKFLPYIIQQLKIGKPIDVTPCEQKRDFLFIEDFAWIIHQVLLNYHNCIGEIVNIGSGESISLKEIIEICRLHLASNSMVNYGALSYRANEVMDLRCSVEKLSSLIKQPVSFDINKRLIDYLDSI